MAKFRFTKTALQSLPLPDAGKRETHYDAEIPKLALRVTAAGAKTFYVVRRKPGGVDWVKLGSFAEMSVEQARKAALNVLGEYADGGNVAEARRQMKGTLTLNEFFVEFGTKHGQKKRSWANDQQRYRDWISPVCGKKKITEITRADIVGALHRAERAGRAVATVRNIRALASVMFAKALEWELIDSNPAQGIKVEGEKVKRDRFLQSDELPRFFEAVAEEEPGMRDFILLALLTGARRGNLCAMHWNEINLSSAEWRIQRTKNGEPQTVTLSPEAVQILEARKDETGGGYVFPGTGRKGHIVEPKKAVERVMSRAGIPYGRDVPDGVTLHDLRRTLGSWQARSGASLTIIGKSLNHKSPQTTAIYARLDLDPVRQSVNTATAAMLEAGGLKAGAEVVPLKRGAA